MKLSGQKMVPKAQNIIAIDNESLIELILKLKNEFEDVFLDTVCGQIFIYRPLGRMEYKDLVADTNFSDVQKEDLICKACTLWPENYDFDNCLGGIPSSLSSKILKRSYLDTLESRIHVTMVYRQEMFDLDYQVACIIHEAFPEMTIDEIESWGVAKTAKYLSRAEWILQNLRGLQIAYDPEAIIQEQEERKRQEKKQPKTQEIKPAKQEDIQVAKKGGQLTIEQFEELKRKYPEMQWGNNVLDPLTVESLNDAVDTTHPALRPGF